MSHNYPYRRSDTDLRPDPGPYGSADRRHPSSDFYRPQESFSYPSSSSSSSRAALQLAASQDGVLSILSSCGLEPEALTLLAKLPEDILTVESLPHILKQINGKRGSVNLFPSSTPSSSSSSYLAGSAHRPPSTLDLEQLRSQPVQYPLHLISSTSLPSNQDHWGTFRTHRADAPSSSSSSPGFSVDYHHRPGPSDYGKTGPGPSQDRPSFSPAEQGTRARPSRYSEARPADSRAAPPPKAKPQEGRWESGSSCSRSIPPLVSMPFMKQALDFHGTTPPAYPYSCSLCQITVLSERVWIQHINGTLHADGQLSLLQQFPNWDCRMETVIGEDDQSEKRRDDKKPSPPWQTSNQSQTSQTNQKLQKTADQGKVVCVKFPAQSVDETYLRKLTEPFGKILKILMFPSLAFVDLLTVDQARDLVKFHVNYPPTVNGEKIEFSISNTFSFLRSSQVVSFSPAPAGEDGRSDLLSIVKRFGLPLYTLFLPSMAFVEMKNILDAKKLVDYYSTNTLRISSNSIKVSCSVEFKSLMNVPSAKRYEEEPPSVKRARSSSREKDEKSETKRTRRESSRDRKTRSRSRDKRSRSRERSKERCGRHRKSRSRSRDKFSSTSSRKNRSRSRSRDKSSRNRRTRTKSRSRSRDKSRTKSSRETRSKSREKSNREKKSRGSESKSRDKSSTGPSVEKMVESESRSEDEPASLSDSKPEATDTEQTEEEAEVSAEEDDIEGMEVIEEQEEEEEEEEAGEENDSPQSLEQDEEEDETEDQEAEEDGCGLTKEESEETAETQEDEEPDVPVDLKNCITQDELDKNKSNRDDRVRDEPQSSRVLYFASVPLEFTDSDFINLVRDFGTAVRYILLRGRQEGFIEMSSSSEASKAARKMYFRPPPIYKNLPPIVRLSYKYHRLSNGTVVPLHRGSRRRSKRRSPSRSRSKSRTSDRGEADKRVKRKKESSKKSPEKESASRKTPEKDLTSKKTSEENSASKKTPEKGSASRDTPEEDSKSRKIPEKDSTSTKSPEKDSTSRKTPEKDSTSRTSPEEDSTSRKIPEEDSTSRKIPEEDSTSRKTPEKDSTSRTSPEEDSTSRKTPEKDSTSRTTPEKDSTSRKTPEEDSTSRKTPEEDSTCTKTPEEDSTSRKTPENESLSKKAEEKNLENTSEKDDAGRNTPEEETSPENETQKREETPKYGSVSQETMKTESAKDRKDLEIKQKPEDDQLEEKLSEADEPRDKEEKTTEVCLEFETSESKVKDSESPDPPVGTGDGPKPQAEQADDAAAETERRSEPEKSAKPVGTEFVRPVVGYFCKLCQLIFADEDEAKQQHCSSPTHYSRYQEQTGKDPWTS